MNFSKFYLFIFILGTLWMTSCSEDEPCGGACPIGFVCENDACVADPNFDICEGVTCPTGQICVGGQCITPADTTVVKVTQNITSNTTWTSGKCYILTGRIAVTSGVTLTIQPNVIVKGEVGTGANATALLIARGAKINAEGTKDQPIIFTSIADEIMPGQVVSPNLDDDINGLWGGLIILGNAPISADANAVQIEGIPANDQNGLYGGDNPQDNSGVLKYVSIRHGGANIGEGNEINGLTLGGVGAGTVIEYIEVVSNSDDGIEWFGGTVNVKNAIVWGAGDDLFDVDQAYSGTISNFVGVLNSDSDHGLELDGPEGSREGTFTLTDGSLIGDLNTANGEYADLRAGVTCNISNVYFTGFKSSSDFELDNAGVSQNWLDGKIVLSNLNFNVSHLTEGNITLDKIFKDDGGNDEAFNTAALNFAKIVSTKTGGANVSEFSGWSLTDRRGKLSGL